MLKPATVAYRLAALTLSAFAAIAVSGQNSRPSPPATTPGAALFASWSQTLKWRSIGPAAMGGRITGLSVYEADPSIYWVATAGGGLLKTSNNGVTFEYQFQNGGSASVGAVCVAPSNPNVVWLGTGESNPRNSVSYGDGVYKSVDGGKSWTRMGLEKSFQTGDMVVHPTNPDIVYVGALGRLWGQNPERGLFKTTDGGKTWSRILYVDDKTGVVDIAMKPDDPDTLLVAMWERQRDGFDSHRGEPPVEDGYDAYDPIKKWGPGSGIYKTTNGGRTWSKITKGLPTSMLGRIGLDYYRKSPNIVYAVVDCEKIGLGLPPSNVYMGIQGESRAGGGARLTEVTEGAPGHKAGLASGDVVLRFGDQEVKDYEGLTALIRAKQPGDKVVVEYRRADKTERVEVTLETRPIAGGRGRGGGRFAGFGLVGARVEDHESGAVRLSRVFEDGAASAAGLQDDDLIKQVDGQPLDSQAFVDLLQKKKPGDKVALVVQRDNKTIKVEFTVREARPPGSSGSPARPYSASIGGQRENAQDQQGSNGYEYGGVYRSEDGGESWTRVNSLNPRPMYFSKIRVDPSDDNYVYVCGIQLYRSKDGGKAFRNDGGERIHDDHHALWIDPRDGRHMIVGGDGGFHVTYDRMDRWDHLNQAAIGQFYHAEVDTSQPYYIVGGLQDNGSWRGPSRSLSNSGTVNTDWVRISGGDGFVCRADPTDPDWVYYESQDGAFGRRNLKTGFNTSIRPPRDPKRKFRFNWNSPFALSAHNSKIFYCAGNYLFRSLKQGDDLQVISPELSRTSRGTATAIAESPRNPSVIWVGTDDGYLWVTKDGGTKWSNLSYKLRLPSPRWVATIEASRFAEGRAYVALDAHRSDDDDPYLFVTEDYGQTWKSLRANLPSGSARCLREDLKNPDLLYAGTEFGAWTSVDRGATWAKLGDGLPTVAVHELALHPVSGEVIAATHGRSLWALDIVPLRQMTAAERAAPAALFEPTTVFRWRSEPSKGIPGGDRRFIGQNPARGAQIYYSLAAAASNVRLTVTDLNGRALRELDTKTEAGLHHVAWDLTIAPPRQRVGRDIQPGPRRTPAPTGNAETPAQNPTSQPEAAAQPQQRPTFGSGRTVPSGAYRLTLTVDGKEYVQTVRVEDDPTMPPGSVVTSADEQRYLDEERAAEKRERRELAPLDD